MEWLQFTFLAFPDFRVFVFKTSIEFGMSCVNCVIHRGYSGFLAFLTLSEKNMYAPDVVEDEKAEWKILLLSYENIKVIIDFWKLHYFLGWIEIRKSKQDSLKGIRTNNKPKMYWLLCAAICCTWRMIASVRGFSRLRICHRH